MYVTGTLSTFASRLHQMGNDAVALPSFKTEASGFWTGVDANMREKYDKEARLCTYRISGQGSGLFVPFF